MKTIWLALLSIFTVLSFVALSLSSDMRPRAQNVIAKIAGGGNPWHISLRLDSVGKPVISFSAVKDSLWVAHCGNATCTSGNTINTVDHTYAEGPTSLVLGSSGDPVVAYRYGRSYNPAKYTLKMLFCQDPNCAHSTNIITGLPSTASGVGPSLALDSVGNPVISYGANGSLRVQHCGDATCSSNNVDIGVGGGIPYNGGLALDAAGNPVVAVASSDTLGVVHCGNAYCSSGNKITQGLSYLGDVGVNGQVSLSLDAAGNPVMSYLYQSILDATAVLHVIHCGDPNCTSGNVDNIVDQMAGAQAVTSLALDASGNPVIAYTQSTADLAVAHCGDAYCASGNTIAQPASDGHWASLTLDAQGRPVVAFAGSRSLWVLHCATTTCQ